MFFEAIYDLEEHVDLHIIGGDLFDRVPSMDELTLYFDFIKGVKVPTIIFDGNHEATKKNKTFFSNLTRATSDVNPLVDLMFFCACLLANPLSLETCSFAYTKTCFSMNYQTVLKTTI